MVMTGIRAAIQSCLKCVGRHIDLYCLTLVVGYGLTRALLNLTYGIAVATINGLFSLSWRQVSTSPSPPRRLLRYGGCY